jgi:hypothetical protein
MRILGQQLRDHIVQPFLHLQLSSPAKDPLRLQIYLWDPNERALPSEAKASTKKERGKPEVFFSPNGRFVLERSTNASLALDRMQPAIVGRFAWSEHLLAYERCKPMSRLLVEWFNDRNLPVVHAGLVSRKENGVLLAGGSGSGKSTSALMCLQTGYDFLSEDYVAVQSLDDGSFLGHSMYSSVFLEKHQLAHFPEFHDLASDGNEDDKLAIILSHAFPQRLKRAVPIRALILCEIGVQQSAHIRPANKIEALRTLGLSSLMQIPNRGQRSLDDLASLIERMPSFWLRLGRDLTSIPHCIDRVLVEVGE